MTKTEAEKQLRHNREYLDHMRAHLKSDEEYMNRSKKIYEENRDAYELRLTDLREYQQWVNFLEQQIEKLPE